MQPSDEEVLGYSEDGSSVDDDLENGDAASDHESPSSSIADDEDDADNLRDWGTSKADYYDADVIETEADALEEEQEARRLQRKHLQSLTEADFGFDEHLWVREGPAGNEYERDLVRERLPELQIKEDASSKEMVQILKSRYPEFEPLAKDFVELQTVHDELSLAAEAVNAVMKIKGSPRKTGTGIVAENTLVHQTPMATSKLRALSAYLGAIGMYFALLTSTTNSASPKALALSPVEIREHPVVQILFRSRQLWESIKDTAIPDLQTVAREAGASSLGEARPESGVNSLETPDTTIGEPPVSKMRRTKAKRADIKAQHLAETKRNARIQKTEDKLADLDRLVLGKVEGKRRPTKTIVDGENNSDFGDEEALTAQEAAEKAHRRRSLRFYTSQIAQKSNKREAASRDAGGDADLPYKERLKDRQARLTLEAERRGRSDAGQDERLDNKGNDDSDKLLAREVRGDDLEDSDYYDTVFALTKHKKEERKAFAEAKARAASEGGQVHLQEQVGPDGKRAITYAIAKNKGLMPRRKKEVRNPRVKKKIRFEQKMKKLGSIRQIYKGGEGRGGYGGELTGIKTNVLKGVKL